MPCHGRAVRPLVFPDLVVHVRAVQTDASIKLVRGVIGWEQSLAAAAECRVK